jgi:hypothetical protein
VEFHDGSYNVAIGLDERGHGLGPARGMGHDELNVLLLEARGVDLTLRLLERVGGVW